MRRDSVMKIPELWYSVVVKDRHGKVISCERRRAHSFLKQWNQFIWYFHCLGTISPRIITGAPTRLDSHDNNFKMNAGEGDASLGIVIGTDNTPQRNSYFNSPLDTRLLLSGCLSRELFP